MLRMCDSTVFALRNSSAAISRFVLRSAIRATTSSSRFDSSACAPASSARRLAGLVARAQAAQLAPHLVAHAQRSALVELALDLAQQRDRRLALAGRDQGARLEAAREGGLQVRARSRRPSAADSCASRAASRGSPRASRTAARVRNASAEGRRRSEARGVLLGAAGVLPGRLEIADGELDEREALPVEAALDRHRARAVVAAELEQDRASPLDLAGLDQRDAQPPAGSAAAVRDRAAGEARIDARALLVGRDRAVEIARVVARPAELEERAVELVRARREARHLDHGLADRRRLHQPALHLAGEVLDEHQRHEQPPVAGRARDRDPARRVGARVVVVLEVVLRPREVEQGFQARSELGIRQPVELAARLLAALAGAGRVAGDRLAEAQGRRGSRDQGRVPHFARRRERAACPFDRAVEVELVEPVDGELDLEDGGLCRRAVRQLLPGARQARSAPRRGDPASARRPRPTRSARPAGANARRAAARSPRAGSRASARARRASAAPRRVRREPRPAARDPTRAAGAAPPRTSAPPQPGRARRLPRPRRAAARSPASSPCRADCATWCARSAAGAPRSASAAEARACAARRQPAGADS